MGIWANILGRGAKAAAAAPAAGGAGGSILKTVIGTAGGLVATGGLAIGGGAVMNASGEENWFKRALGGWFNTGARLTAEASQEGMFAGIFQFVELLAKMCDRLNIKGGIPEALRKFANGTNGSGPAAAGGANGGAGGNGSDPDGNDGPSGGIGHTLGVAALGTGIGAAGFFGARAIKNMIGGGKPGLSSVAGGADDAIKVMQAGQLGDDVVRGASRFGKWGKIAGVAGLVGLSVFGSGSPAEASTMTSAAAGAGGGLTANVNNNEGSLGISKGDIAGMGLSIVGSKVAAQSLASVATPALAGLGIKAIPGIASIYAAGEGIYNTASYAFKGEFAKAGLSFVSGVGETVAGLGGAATYLTVGTAWREAVRAGGAMAFGEENTIEHSAVVNVGSYLKDAFFGASNNTANAPAPQALAPRAAGPALAF